MKQIRYFIVGMAVLFFGMGLLSCEDEITPEDFGPSQTGFSYYAMTASGPSIHYVVGSEINFETELGSSWEWDFGDGNTSSEKNPTHKYAMPGTYKVGLKIDGGEKTIWKNIFISPIVPVVTYKAIGDTSIVFKQTQVEFDVLIENPENKEIGFKWVFPAGSEGVEADGTSTAKDPTVKFGRMGSQRVQLVVTVGDEELTPVNVNVKVNYNKPVKTIYYAVKGGNIMYKNIINDPADALLNDPYDTGFRSGKHALTLQFSGKKLYVFDAGTFTGYVASPKFLTAGDGEIFTIDIDGKKENIINNFGGNSFLDFFYGYIDEAEGQIYFADRRNGVMKISTKTRNSKLVRKVDEGNPEGAEKYVWQNTWLGYYGNGIGWGNQNGPFFKYKGLWWWAKHSLGSGLYRFEDSDISPSPSLPAAGRVLDFRQIRGMVMDQENEVLYYADQAAYRIRRFTPSTDADQTVMNYRSIDNTDGEGGAAESLFVTGMAVDGDYFYWAFRGPKVPEGQTPEDFYAANPNYRSGIYRVPLSDPVSANIELFIKDTNVYGIAVDKTER